MSDEFRKQLRITRPQFLTLEGGGAAGAGEVGAILELHEQGLLSDITSIAGTSAGAIIGLALACGMQPARLPRLLQELPDLSDGHWLFARRRLARGWGLWKGEALTQFLRDIVKTAVPHRDPDHLTLVQLSSFSGIDFHPWAYSFLDGRTVNLRLEYHDMPAWAAARASASIPGYFAVFRWGNATFWDGGLSLNDPIRTFDTAGQPTAKTLGIRVGPSGEWKRLRGEGPPLKFVPGVRNFLRTFLRAMLALREQQHLAEHDWWRTAFVESLGIGTTDFKAAKRRADELIESGRKGMREHLAWRFDQGIPERTEESI